MARYSVQRDKLYEAFDLYSKELCETLPSDEELAVAQVNQRATRATSARDEEKSERALAASILRHE